MKTIRAVLVVSFLASALVVLGATRALACSCVAPRSDRVALEDATAVFAGTVAAVEPGVEIGVDPATWTFAVDTVYKGPIGTTQDVSTHTQPAACGVVFDEGARYVVFAYEGDESVASEGGLVTNSCMNTRELDPDEELGLAGKPPPADSAVDGDLRPDDGSVWDPFVVIPLALAGLAVALSAFALVTGRTPD